MARCRVCSGETGNRRRMHIGPDDCLKAIDAQIDRYEDNLSWLRSRRETIEGMMADAGIAEAVPPHTIKM